VHGQASTMLVTSLTWGRSFHWYVRKWEEIVWRHSCVFRNL